MMFTCGIMYAGVAQLVRAPPCHGGGCGFKSRLSRTMGRRVAKAAFVFVDPHYFPVLTDDIRFLSQDSHFG